MISRREIDFLLHEWLSIDQLFERPEYAEHSRDTIDAMLDVSSQLAADRFLTSHREVDTIEPTLDADGVHVLDSVRVALGHYADLGLFAAGFPPEHGGLGLPLLAYVGMFVQFAAANVSTASFPMLTAANARMILSFGTPAQIETFAVPEIEGRWFGTMCLSEPQAGSSLGDIVTRAEPAGEDELGLRYRLTGNKMWISSGDHDASENIVHLVLAKVPGADGRLPAGTKGISLFIVPKVLPDGTRNDITVAGLNHKMGYRGIPNCLLSFGDDGGAVGWRVGGEGEGLRQMFQMMNEARIMVGVVAAGLAYRGYRHAVDYARERTQGRVAGARGGEMVPIIEHADVKHMLLAQKVYAEGALAITFYAARLMDEEGDPDADALLGLLTPMVKTWPSELGLVANELAIQVHGGYGYTRDFAVEQLYREQRLNPIHEGTTGIQAIDLVGRKLLDADGHGFSVLVGRVTDTVRRAEAVSELAPCAGDLESVLGRIVGTVESLRSDRTGATDNATFLLRAFGHVVVGWLLLDQALVAASSASEYHAGKVHGCRYYFENEVPKVSVWLDTVAARSDLAASAPASTFD